MERVRHAKSSGQDCTAYVGLCLLFIVGRNVVPRHGRHGNSVVGLPVALGSKLEVGVDHVVDHHTDVVRVAGHNHALNLAEQEVNAVALCNLKRREQARRHCRPQEISPGSQTEWSCHTLGCAHSRGS